MTLRADRIFSGRCVATEVIRHPATGLRATRVTFEVERAVKGDLGATVTLTLLGRGDAARGPDPAAMPRFVPGARVVLFLYADSPLGLTSPVGFGAGSFSVVLDKEGRERAVNAVGNRNLPHGPADRSTHGRAGEVHGPSPAEILDAAAALLAANDARPGAAGRSSGAGGVRP